MPHIYKTHWFLWDLGGGLSILLFSESFVWSLESDPHVHSLAGMHRSSHNFMGSLSQALHSLWLPRYFLVPNNSQFLVLWPETVALVISLFHILPVIAPRAGIIQQKRKRQWKKNSGIFVPSSWDHSFSVWRGGIFPFLRVLGTYRLSLLPLSLLSTLASDFSGDRGDLSYSELC